MGKEFRYAIIRSLPVMCGYVFLGIAFGIVLQQAGYNFIWAFPFLIFRGKQGMPVFVKNIADKLPPAIIAVLVIYCLKGDLFQISTSAAASAIALTAVVPIHLWKRNTLLSIAVGTVI